MNQPSIIISTDEELALVCQLIYYNSTGYHSNARKLYKAIKDEGYSFPYKKIRDWLHNQSSWQIYAPPPKNITRASYGRISRPNCVHQADILFLTHDKYREKTYKAVLNIVDCASRYKASVPLTSKKSSEVAKAFKKIYNNSSNPLTWPKLLTVDGGREYMAETAQILQEHKVIIRVIGAYSHRGLAIVDRFCKTLAEMLYRVQYAVESISSDPKLIRAWVKYLPEVIDYLNNYSTRLIRAPGSSKWGLAPSKAIKLEKVKSKPSISRKRAIGKDEEKLKKDDMVRYLLADGEWEGSPGLEQRKATDPIYSPTLFKIGKIVVTKNEPVLYYLSSDDEYSPTPKEDALYLCKGWDTPLKLDE
ncbi:17431_t:CDS:2 [Gigaspora rosea]|nr:17431_t:CDS:2 [Gigaspora rosea]